MKKNLKICLPVYKIVYSFFFVVLLSFVRGIAQIYEIGIAMDANIALLAIIFCADSYEIEYREKRWEIFELFPQKNRVKTIRIRLFIQCVYLWLISILGYWFFYWQKPGNYFLESSPVILYGLFLFAVACSIFFWGTLSMTIVNFVHHLWAGIGITLIIWLFMTSKIGEKLLGNANVFGFTFRKVEEPNNFDWMYGKWIAVIIAIGMILVMQYSVKNKFFTHSI